MYRRVFPPVRMIAGGSMNPSGSIDSFQMKAPVALSMQCTSPEDVPKYSSWSAIAPPHHDEPALYCQIKLPVSGLSLIHI